VPGYLVRLRDGADEAAARLRHEDWVTGVEEEGNDLRVAVRSMADAESRLVAVLAAAGARVVSVAPEAADLEDVFLELTR
jgi:ABC-2 type transport system ATP-binding protein